MAKKTVDFNPIREDKDGVKAKRIIWSTSALDMAIKGMTEGRRLVANPFYENNVKLLKGDLVFQRTQEELVEWVKSKNDIHHFVAKYCKLMTPEGIQNITLRDYQHRYLDHLKKHQLSIYLACRQCGKCLSFNEVVKIKTDLSIDIKWEIEVGVYELPLYELYNYMDDSLEWAIQYDVYKKYNDGELTERELYKELENNLLVRGYQKIIRSHMFENTYVWTDSGWSPVGYIHMTTPFEMYHIELDGDLCLDCADDHIVFRDGYEQIYVKDLSEGDFILTSSGPRLVKQVINTGRIVNMCDMTVYNERESYYTSDILSHNTTTTCVYLLHYLLFNVDKNSLICANILKTAKEIIDKTKKVFLEIPYFLKPGIYKWNETEIVFDNGCRAQCTSTTGSSGIGFTIHCLILDEFAHVAPNVAEKFYNNIFPTIISANSSCIITSTQNGRNLFYRLYKAAEAGESDYGAFKTDWFEVPDWSPEKKCWVKRDEEWKAKQVANYGSEEAFNSQFGTNFDISSNTLISQKILSRKALKVVDFIEKEIPGVNHSDSFKWHPNFDPINLKKEYIVITGDLAEGGGGDYTIFNINRLIEPGSGKMECVGYFRSNKLDRVESSMSLQELIVYHCDQNKTLLSFEKNTYGDLFHAQMIENNEKCPHLSDFDMGVVVKYYNEAGSKYVVGIKLTSGNKSNYCKLFKESYERDLYINDSYDLSVELGNFNDDGSGHYKAIFGHDDFVMTSVQLEFVKGTIQYKMLKNEFDSSVEMSVAENDVYNPFDNPYMDDIMELDMASNISRLNRFTNI